MIVHHYLMEILMQMWIQKKKETLSIIKINNNVDDCATPAIY